VQAGGAQKERASAAAVSLLRCRTPADRPAKGLGMLAQQLGFWSAVCGPIALVRSPPVYSLPVNATKVQQVPPSRHNHAKIGGICVKVLFF
jgi:hypothetical protein